MLVAGGVVAAVEVVVWPTDVVIDMASAVGVDVDEVTFLHEVHGVFDEAVTTGAQAQHHERDQPGAQNARRS